MSKEKVENLVEVGESKAIADKCDKVSADAVCINVVKVDVNAADFDARVKFIESEIRKETSRLRKLKKVDIYGIVKNFLETYKDEGIAMCGQEGLGLFGIVSNIGECRELAFHILDYTNLKGTKYYDYEDSLIEVIEEAIQTQPCVDGVYRNADDFCVWIEQLELLYDIEPRDLTAEEIQALKLAGVLPDDSVAEDTNDSADVCPYCGSSNVDLVDSEDDSKKMICRDCGQDYIVWDNGEITDRHNRKI